MIPLRFVAVCEAGHIEDFPWNAWVHTDSKEGLSREAGCAPEALYFYATKRGGLSGLVVECASCSRKRPLLGVTNRGGLKGLLCQGERPWLGKDGREPCPMSGKDAVMMALQRGASNLYFPEVNSSILIPPHSSKVMRLLKDPLVRRSLTADGVTPASDEVFAAIALVKRVDADQLKAAFTRQHDIEEGGADLDETEFRRTEYLALQQPRRERGDWLECSPQPPESYASVVQDFVRGVTLVERLTETRALTSFRRLAPGVGAPSQLSRAKTNWLPAFQVHGEGIFLTFDTSRLSRLAGNSSARINRLIGRAVATKRCPLAMSPDLVFLHTFAHLLIKRLSFEAGYGTSSIRERLYSSTAVSGSMAGILLYTAAGDADGTLGGLVSLGRSGTLERIVAAAIDDGRWCAADPICVESDGQGPESLNLAACHACALLPETSCELQNRYLDRKLVQQFFDNV
jgi:hypothetical protein